MNNIDGKILMQLHSGKTLREIIDEGDFNQQAYIHKNREQINVMVENWIRYRLSHPTKESEFKNKYNSRSGLYISS